MHRGPQRKKRDPERVSIYILTIIRAKFPGKNFYKLVNQKIDLNPEFIINGLVTQIIKK